MQMYGKCPYVARDAEPIAYARCAFVTALCMRRDHAAEVIEQHGDRGAFHEIPDRRDHRGRGLDLDVPAAPTHPFDGRLGQGMSISVNRVLR
jgi:hypothetical protein